MWPVKVVLEMTYKVSSGTLRSMWLWNKFFTASAEYQVQVLYIEWRVAVWQLFQTSRRWLRQHRMRRTWLRKTRKNSSGQPRMVNRLSSVTGIDVKCWCVAAAWFYCADRTLVSLSPLCLFCDAFHIFWITVIFHSLSIEFLLTDTQCRTWHRSWKVQLSYSGKWTRGQSNLAKAASNAPHAHTLESITIAIPKICRGSQKLKVRPVIQTRIRIYCCIVFVRAPSYLWAH